MKRYYSLAQEGATADIDIYGDITSWEWSESDVSAYSLSKRLSELEGVDTINVNINSYGGEVAEGLAIHNALKRHPAKVVTRCDGFACSIASVIFMSGDERIMHDASLLMIHNAWTSVFGANASELRKQADDLDVITQASKNAYMANVCISEDELTALMDDETWLSAQESLEMGFATSVESFDAKAPSQSARKSACERIRAAAPAKPPADPEPGEPVRASADPDPEPEPEPEPETEPDAEQQSIDAFCSFIAHAFKQ